MVKRFFSLEWKAFFRSASFQEDLIITALLFLGVLWIAASFIGVGFGLYFILEKWNIGEPFEVINRFLIYYFILDLIFRYFLQKMPVIHIKPFLHLPLKKSQIVHKTLIKLGFSYFNWIHAFLFVPLCIVLLIKNYQPLGLVTWSVGIAAIIYTLNYLNILINNKNGLFYSIAVLVVGLLISQYYQIFDITVYTKPVFQALYETPPTVIILLVLLVVVYRWSFSHFRNRMYLDAGLSVKVSEVKTENLYWLDKFGSMAVFLKNDIKLIKRNKRPRTTIFASILLLFYGLLFFGSNDSLIKIFAGIFSTGGFLFSFGQYVPSWDSAYYPLMMSQNISYNQYLQSKYYLILLVTMLSTVLCSFYLYFGWDAFLAVLAGGIYNCGVNAYMVLWAGAYIKTPIDLTSSKGAFGDKQAFNLKTLLLTIPKITFPIIIFLFGYFLISPKVGYLLVALTGLLGFVFKGRVFKLIENIYKREKYKTLVAYKQKK